MSSNTEARVLHTVYTAGSTIVVVGLLTILAAVALVLRSTFLAPDGVNKMELIPAAFGGGALIGITILLMIIGALIVTLFTSASATSYEGVLIWSNTADGNDHSLIYNNGLLTLTVIKRDGTTFSKTRPTRSTAAEWIEAFENLGSEWIENDRVDGYPTNSTRRSRPTAKREVAHWDMEHFEEQDDTYTLHDNFTVAAA